jgi:hypothetical protein
MNTVINNAATERFERAKRILYSFEVLIIGVLIPFLFIIGINTNYGNKPGDETGISKPRQEKPVNGIANITAFLFDQHS